MRILIRITFAVIIVLSTLMSVYATNGNEVLALQNREYEEECNDVRLAVEAGMNEYSSYIGIDPETIDFDMMYRCYEVENEDLAKAFEKNENFADNISETYCWIVPKYAKNDGSSINNGGEVAVIENNEVEFGWVINDGLNYPIIDHDTKLDYTSVCNLILAKHPDADISTVRALNSKTLNCRLYYFSENDTEYLLPVFLLEEPEWAKSGEIYEAGDFIEKGEIYFPSNPEQQGGFFEGLRNNLDYIIIVSVAVIIALVAVGVYIKTKKRSED